MKVRYIILSWIFGIAIPNNFRLYEENGEPSGKMLSPRNWRPCKLPSKFSITTKGLLQAIKR